MKIIIGIKYCGGCNSQIDRLKIIRNVENSLADGYQFTDNPCGKFFDIGILVCGCPAACARKSELVDLTADWIVVAGKTVDSLEMAEGELSEAIIQKIKAKKCRTPFSEVQCCRLENNGCFTLFNIPKAIGIESSWC